MSGSCAAANAQEHREERREVKIDGSSGPTHSPAQADVSQSKYDCASLFCATLPNRARLFLFHRYPLKSAYFGCPGVEQGEVKLVLSAVPPDLALQQPEFVLQSCKAMLHQKSGLSLCLDDLSKEYTSFSSPIS